MQVENIVTMVRNEVKGAGLQDTRENCWKFFIDRVRRQLKVNESWLAQQDLCLKIRCDSGAPNN